MTPRPTVDELEARVREALDETCPFAYALSCDLPEHANAKAAQFALSDLAARAKEAEAKLEEIGEITSAVLRAGELLGYRSAP